MMVRLIDLLIALFMLLISLPLVLIGILGIKITSSGPIFYQANRVGKNGRTFRMYKLRTMHFESTSVSVITSSHDPRIFWFGNILRKTKIDELPQFANVLFGDMSIVGPRPEDPKIVNLHYKPWMMATLKHKPGVTSPGAIFGYTMNENILDHSDAEGAYVDVVLPLKLAIDRVYFDQRTMLGDIRVIFNTAWAIIAQITGWKAQAVGIYPRDAKDFLRRHEYNENLVDQVE